MVDKVDVLGARGEGDGVWKGDRGGKGAVCPAHTRRGTGRPGPRLFEAGRALAMFKWGYGPGQNGSYGKDGENEGSGVEVGSRIFKDCDVEAGEVHHEAAVPAAISGRAGIIEDDLAPLGAIGGRWSQRMALWRSGAPTRMEREEEATPGMTWDRGPQGPMAELKSSGRRELVRIVVFPMSEGVGRESQVFRLG